MQSAPRRGLSRTRILDAAVELMSSDMAFSMRNLAERLDVSAMALYRWFANKDELLDALTERMVGANPAATVTGHESEGPWARRALHYAVGIRRSLLQHLPLLQIDGASKRLTANVVRNSHQGLRLMLELGYRDREAVDAYRVLFWSVLNYCLVVDATDALPGVGESNAVIEGILESEGDDLAMSMPSVASLLPFFTAVDPDEFFERTIRTVLTGLAADAPAGGAPGRVRPRR